MLISAFSFVISPFIAIFSTVCYCPLSVGVICRTRGKQNSELLDSPKSYHLANLHSIQRVLDAFVICYASCSACPVRSNQNNTACFCYCGQPCSCDVILCEEPLLVVFDDVDTHPRVVPCGEQPTVSVDRDCCVRSVERVVNNLIIRGHFCIFLFGLGCLFTFLR